MDKESRLRKSNTFNPKRDKIKDSIFKDEIMDPQDLLQVRYEMVRAIEYDNKPIGEVSSAYGVSVTTARRYIDDLKKGGLKALVPGPKGPAGPSKLKKEASDFIDNYHKNNPKAGGAKIHAALEAKLRLGISKRTVERNPAKKD